MLGKDLIKFIKENDLEESNIKFGGGCYEFILGEFKRKDDSLYVTYSLMCEDMNTFGEEHLSDVKAHITQFTNYKGSEPAFEEISSRQALEIREHIKM